MAPQLSDILKLSISERMLWVETIWNSIATDSTAASEYALNEGQISLLNEELEAYKADSDGGMTWKEAETKIRNG